MSFKNFSIGTTYHSLIDHALILTVDLKSESKYVALANFKIDIALHILSVVSEFFFLLDNVRIEISLESCDANDFSIKESDLLTDSLKFFFCLLRTHLVFIGAIYQFDLSLLDALLSFL